MWDNDNWMLDRITTQLPLDIKNIILNIPLPRSPAPQLEDQWVWDGNNKGLYTVASGYHWLLSHQRQLPQNQDSKWIWKTCAPAAKVQFVIRLVFHEALPTNHLRYMRGLAATPRYQRCSGHREDILHILRDCPHSRKVWFRCGIRISLAFFSQQKAITWIKHQVKRDSKCLFLASIWWMWCWRNHMVLGDNDWDI